MPPIEVAGRSGCDQKPFTSQHYIGETDNVQDPSRVQGSYSAEKRKRLERIRAKYDPQGVFFGFLGGTAKADGYLS